MAYYYSTHGQPAQHPGGKAGFKPVDPFRPSMAVGVQNVIGDTERDELTIDNVPVPLNPPIQQPSWPSYGWGSGAMPQIVPWGQQQPVIVQAAPSIERSSNSSRHHGYGPSHTPWTQPGPEAVPWIQPGPQTVQWSQPAPQTMPWGQPGPQTMPWGQPFVSQQPPGVTIIPLGNPSRSRTPSPIPAHARRSRSRSSSRLRRRRPRRYSRPRSPQQIHRHATFAPQYAQPPVTIIQRPRSHSRSRTPPRYAPPPVIIQRPRSHSRSRSPPRLGSQPIIIPSQPLHRRSPSPRRFTQPPVIISLPQPRPLSLQRSPTSSPRRRSRTRSRRRSRTPPRTPSPRHRRHRRHRRRRPYSSSPPGNLQHAPAWRTQPPAIPPPYPYNYPSTPFQEPPVIVQQPYYAPEQRRSRPRRHDRYSQGPAPIIIQPQERSRSRSHSRRPIAIRLPSVRVPSPPRISPSPEPIIIAPQSWAGISRSSLDLPSQSPKPRTDGEGPSKQPDRLPSQPVLIPMSNHGTVPILPALEPVTIITGAPVFAPSFVTASSSRSAQSRSRRRRHRSHSRRGSYQSRSRSRRRSPHRRPSYPIPPQPFPPDYYHGHFHHPPPSVWPQSQPMHISKPQRHDYAYGPDVMAHGVSSSYTWLASFLGLVLDQVPRQVYLYMHLRLPALYFSRVTRIFQDADLSMSEIKSMALEVAGSGEEPNKQLLLNGIFPMELSSVRTPFTNLRTSWQSFIDSLMREWKTLNIISVLLLSAILTILQISSAAANPITRYSALLSLICALMSLLYGCMYIIRFGTMRKTYKAAEWAHEAQQSRTSIFWNVWILLAMPATWLGWSMIFYLVCIMSFVWGTGTVLEVESPILTAHDSLGPRIAISGVLGLGLIYFLMIALTFRRYGELMDQAWQRRINNWFREKSLYTFVPQYPDYGHNAAAEQSVRTVVRSRSPYHRSPRNRSASPGTYHQHHQSSSYQDINRSSAQQRSGRSPQLSPIRIFGHQSSPVLQSPDSQTALLQRSSNTKTNLIRLTKVLALQPGDTVDAEPLPIEVFERGLTHDDWGIFVKDVTSAWLDRSNPDEGRQPPLPTPIPPNLVKILNRHNHTFLGSCDIRAVLCEEHSLEGPAAPLLTVYLCDYRNGQLHLGQLPLGIAKLVIFIHSHENTPPTIFTLSHDDSLSNQLLVHTPSFEEQQAVEHPAQFVSSSRMPLTQLPTEVDYRAEPLQINQTHLRREDSPSSQYSLAPSRIEYVAEITTL